MFHNGSSANNISIMLTATGDIDFTRTSHNDFQFLNNLLSPVTSSLQHSGFGNNFPTIDLFYVIINWMLITFHWTLLADVGQINPKTHASLTDLVVDFTTPDKSAVHQ